MISGTRKERETQAAPVAKPEAAPLTYEAVNIQWLDAIHRELKAINSKLSWFVFLSICAIAVSLFSAILR